MSVSANVKTPTHPPPRNEANVTSDGDDCSLQRSPFNVDMLFEDVVSMGVGAANSGSQLFMPILMAPTSTSKKARMLLDTGSTSSFITVGGLKFFKHDVMKKTVLRNATMHGVKETQCKTTLVYFPSLDGLSSYPVRCYVVPQITPASFAPATPSDGLKQFLSEFSLNERSAGPLDVLIGSTDLWAFVRGIKARYNENLVVLDTVYGDLLCGFDDGEAPLHSSNTTTVE